MKSILLNSTALVCAGLLAVALVSAGASDTNSPAKDSKPKKGYETQFVGAKLIADVGLRRIDKFRSLGMQNGFGQDQPLCDFIATEQWTNKFGTSIKQGEEFKIGKAEVVEATDGFGNTGTKLVLSSAAPKEGLVFYCYAFNADEKAYWAIEKPEIEKALKGYFHFKAAFEQ